MHSARCKRGIYKKGDSISELVKTLDTHECSLCNRWLCGKSSYHRHLKDIHRLDKEKRLDEMRKQPKPKPSGLESYVCSNCGKRLFTKNGYKTHLSRFCNVLNMNECPTMLSSECSSSPSRQFFSLRIPYKTDKVACPIEDCGEMLGSYELLAVHCSQKHANVCASGEKQDYSLYEIIFASDVDFNDWLKNISKRTNACFTQHLSTETGEMYYRCHKVGKFGEQIKGRNVKSCCPAFIRIQKNDSGNVSCVYCLGHMLHDINAVCEKRGTEQCLNNSENKDERSHDICSNSFDYWSNSISNLDNIFGKSVRINDKLVQMRYRILRNYHGIKEASVALGTIADILGRTSDLTTVQILEETNSSLWSVIDKIIKPSDCESSKIKETKNDTDDILLPVRCVDSNVAPVNFSCS